MASTIQSLSHVINCVSTTSACALTGARQHTVSYETSIPLGQEVFRVPKRQRVLHHHQADDLGRGVERAVRSSFYRLAVPVNEALSRAVFASVGAISSALASGAMAVEAAGMAQMVNW